jgi:2-polyprenyl-3-methyl-5-hydroxy-6-metoxy-1,4-benzoquinol methylase
VRLDDNSQWIAPATNGTSVSGLWRCTQCSGELEALSSDLVSCRNCGAQFPAVGGIPDMRARGGSSFDADADLEEARRYYVDSRNASLEAVMERLSDWPGIDEATKNMRVRQIMESPGRLRSQLQGWLKPCLESDGLFLDVGCGSGGLLADVARLGVTGAGIDASMMMLVAAKHMIEAHGGIARLACAYAEALPIGSGTLGSVTMFDSIEHVVSVPRTIAEGCRVLKPGGHLAMSTPNRFSLAAEPHVFVWGVGWLPRSLQAPYVRWRSGQDYSGTQLLSTWEMSRQLRQHPDLEFELRVPQIPVEEIEHFSVRKAALARLYNKIATIRAARPALLAVGPFYQVVARRR